MIRTECCEAMQVALAGSEGAQIGLVETIPLEKGVAPRIAYRYRAERGRFLTLFLTFCPWCGARDMLRIHHVSESETG